jgi:hypothetical protein
MSFGERLAQADTLVTTLQTHIWASLSRRLAIVPYGYETHIAPEVRAAMRFLRTPTAKFVRFTPDFFVLDKQKPENLYLLEYKVTQTPLFSQNRIRQMGQATGLSDLDWPDIGQMEADAYDNYFHLHQAGLQVVVLNYCAYHTRPLLCDYIQNIQLLHRDVVTTETKKGSRTPFINFYCPTMRQLSRFLYDEHGVKVDETAYTQAITTLLTQLPITHHPQSPLQTSTNTAK